MREAKFVDATGRLKKFDHFFVPCRLIRYVQIPTEVDIQAAIKLKFGIFLILSKFLKSDTPVSVLVRLPGPSFMIHYPY